MRNTRARAENVIGTGMNDWLAQRYGIPGDVHRRLVSGSLKRCPVCGAVNARQNEECFVCRWHGRFEMDPVMIADGLDLLLEDCPEFLDAILMGMERRPLRRRIGDWFRRVFSRRIDFRA